MTDVLLLTPREMSTGGATLNNHNVVVTDEEYGRLDPALRIFYEKVRENLGLACITAHLRRAGHSTTALNLHGRQPSDEAIVELIRRERPSVVGVSIMYDLHIVDAVRLIRCARQAIPDVFISVGGAFCTYNAQLIAEQVPEADCVAFGEGEVTMVGLLDALKAGNDWRSVAGLFFVQDGVSRSSGAPKLLDLTQSVWPARDVLLAHRAAGIATPVASTFTSRGCHAKCTFCYAPRQPGVVDGAWRMRPVDDVVDEIEYLQHEFATRFIWFNDDNFGGAFADGYSHAMAFAEEVVRRNLKFSFHCEFRVDSGLIDSDSLDLLRRAGMGSALLGLESGAPRTLKNFRKGTTVAYNYDAARMFREKGFDLDPGWIMIEPDTRVKDLWHNLQFIVGSGVHKSGNPFFMINRAIALRGTEMYDRIVGPLPPADIQDRDGVAYDVLREARRDYRVDDPGVEDLWHAWSTVGGMVADRKENELPFLANAIAGAVRRGGGAPVRELLGNLRKWRNGLPGLLVAFLNYGLMAVGAQSGDLGDELVEELGLLVEEFDRRTLGSSFADFRARVESVTSDTRTVAELTLA